MRNAAFRFLGDVGIVVHNARNPHRQEWDMYLAMTRAAGEAAGGDLGRFRQIVFTDGGGPNSAQRRAWVALITKLENGDKIKVAVVSRSIVARGIVTAFRWLGLPMRSFEPEELAEAFAFLVVTNTEAVAICAAVEELCASVDGPVRSAVRVPAYRRKLSGASPDAPSRRSVAPPT